MHDTGEAVTGGKPGEAPARPLELEADGLPARGALRELGQDGWAAWIAQRARGADSLTGLPPYQERDPLSLVERALAKAVNLEAETRHFYGAVEAAETLWNEAKEALPALGPRLRTCADAVLWHVARTASHDLGRTRAAQRLATFIQQEVLATADASQAGALQFPGALQALAALHLPEDTEFWRDRLTRPETAVLALETLIERGVSAQPDLFAQAARTLGKESWRLRALVERSTDGSSRR